MSGGHTIRRILPTLLLLPALLPARTLLLPETVVRSHRNLHESAYDHRFFSVETARLPGDDLSAILPFGGADIIGRTTPGALATASLRGAASGRTLVTVDAVPLNSVQNGVFDLSLFPLAFFESVDIVHGGCSSVRGANAIAGHIGLNLPSMPDSNRLTLGLLAGSGERLESSASLDLRPSPSLGLRSVLIGHISQNRFLYETAGLRLVRSNANASNLAFAGHAFLKRPWGLGRLHALWSTKRIGVPGDPLLQNTKARQADNTLLLVGRISLHTLLPTEADISWFSSDMRYQDPASPFGLPPVDSRHINDQLFIRIGQTWEHLLGSVHYGAEGRWNIVLSTSFGRKERLLLSPFASFELLPFGPAFKLSLRGRLDHSSTFGTVPTGTTGLRILLPFGFVLRSSLSSSFREPSFNDLYWPQDAFARGNPDLRPESSWNLDAGLEHRLGDLWSAQATAFLTSYKDLILWQPGSGGVWFPQNLERARYLGWDSSLELRPLRPILLTGRWTHLLPYNLSPGYEGNFVPYVPFDRLGATLSVTLGPVRAFTRCSYTGFSYTTKANTPASIADASFSWDAGVAASWHGWSLAAAVNDILRPWSFTPRNQPVPGRTVHLELKKTIQFKTSFKEEEHVLP